MRGKAISPPLPGSNGMTSKHTVMVRAMRSRQAGVPIFTFFLPGAKVLEIADVCRLSRSKDGLEGFQRDAIKRHINSIVEYLNSGDVLFPNAILLALSPRATFAKSRGPTPKGMIVAGEPGVLRLPSPSDGTKCGWIVDGQQRSIALARSKFPDRPIPIVAFASDNLEIHREQFILVNKARPLPRRLVDELLPEVNAAHFPADIAVRRIPSVLVQRLDTDDTSPFFGLIQRVTSGREPGRVVRDSELLSSIQRQINQPLGALAGFRSVDGQSTNAQGMYESLVRFWSEVKAAFPTAWGLPPEKSRLMHSAGIAAMSALMDYLVVRSVQHADPQNFIRLSLRSIAPRCAWTSDRWPDISCAWNEIESTPSSKKRLGEQLIRLTQAPAMRVAQ